jgi:hypothetical protein
MVLFRWIMFWKHEIGEQQINCFALIAILSFCNLSSYTVLSMTEWISIAIIFG